VQQSSFILSGRKFITLDPFRNIHTVTVVSQFGGQKNCGDRAVSARLWRGSAQAISLDGTASDAGNA
jgi:hypothetical protein